MILSTQKSFVVRSRVIRRLRKQSPILFLFAQAYIDSTERHTPWKHTIGHSHGESARTYQRDKEAPQHITAVPSGW